MKAELFDRWIAELRNPEAKQGVGYLNYMGEECCLGVLCRVAGVKNTAGHPRDPAVYSQSNAQLSTELMAELGFPNEVGQRLQGPCQCPSNCTVQSQCMEMNDSLELTFPQIADVLEANRGLFVTEGA